MNLCKTYDGVFGCSCENCTFVLLVNQCYQKKGGGEKKEKNAIILLLIFLKSL